MDTEDLEHEIAEFLQKEIDAEFMCKMWTDNGWTLVFVPDLMLDEVDCWIQDNIKGNWRSFLGPRFVFESADDATLFAMTWS